MLRTLRGAALTAMLAVALTGPGAGGTTQAAQSLFHPAKLKLISAGYLTVGTDATYPPMESYDPHGGGYVGADIDLANAFAKAMGLKGAKIINNSFDTLIPAMQRGKFDVVMSSMNDTPDRRKKVNFVDYMRVGQGIVVKKSSSIHADSYSGMCGHSISVERGTTELDGLLAADKKCKSKIDIHTFTGDTDAYQAFASGHVESYTTDLVVAALYIKQHPTLRLAGKPFAAGEDYGIAILKNNSALKAAVQKAVTKVRASGEYAKILSKWGVSGGAL